MPLNPHRISCGHARTSKECNTKRYQKNRQVGNSEDREDWRQPQTSRLLAGHPCGWFAIQEAGPDALLQAFANNYGLPGKLGDPDLSTVYHQFRLCRFTREKVDYCAAHKRELLFVCAAVTLLFVDRAECHASPRGVIQAFDLLRQMIGR